jgi:hypothetical protein
LELLESVLRRGKEAHLEAQRLGRGRFGGKWYHILVILGRALRSLLPLTSRVLVQGIARDPVSREWGFRVLHTVKGSLEVELKVRSVFKLLEKLCILFDAIVDVFGRW